MKTKAAVLLSGALIALLLLSRYFAPSRARWDAKNTRQAAHPMVLSYPEPPVPVSERFRELEALRAAGAISDTEYSAKRAHIMSPM